MPVLKRKERDKQIRKNDILEAAVKVFAAKGYYDTTMYDIAKEAQYAVGTLYLYFKDKEFLYITLIEEKIEELIRKARYEVEKVKGAKEKLRILIETQLSCFEKDADFFRIYFSQSGTGGWTIKNKISQNSIMRFVKYMDYVAELVKEAQSEHLIEKRLEAKKIAGFLMSMIQSSVVSWLREGSVKGEGLKGMSDFILNIYLEGVGVKK